VIVLTYVANASVMIRPFRELEKKTKKAALGQLQNMFLNGLENQQ
jgi:hypothetical protein